MRAEVYRPNGGLYGEYESSTPPIIVGIPNPEIGVWTCKVTAVDVPYANYPIAVVAAIAPSQTPVSDTIPPEITISASPDMLWPPNHKMVPIAVTVTVVDDYDPAPAVGLASITMNEGEEATVGDGNTKDDIQIDGSGNISLRAERSGTGSGRVYTITYTATDASGNTASASATVTVPHDRGKRMP